MRKTPIILFKFVTAAKSIARKLSDVVCQISGNGVGIKCKIGTFQNINFKRKQTDYEMKIIYLFIVFILAK